MASWLAALKEWNTRKGGCWCIPRKGTAEYEQVKEIMDDMFEGQLEVEERKERAKVVRRRKK